MPKRFGNSSISNGQFWYGKTTNFPGFLYKKNGGAGIRRSTQFAAGGNTTTNCSCGVPTYLYNQYKPGLGGVGATNTAVRRAKNRLATVCSVNSRCGAFYQYLGRYD